MGQTCSKTWQEDQKQYQRHESRPSMGDQSVAIVYQNGNFTLPNRMPFQKQSTYVKIQKAAFNFCQQNNIDLDFLPCITRIIAYRQQKVFLASFNKTPQSKKQSFMEEVNRIPQDQIDLFYHNFVNETHKKYSLAHKKSHLISFKIPELENLSEKTNKPEQQKKLRQISQQMIHKGEVALVIMCAGSSSRFDDQDKFLVPLKLNINPNLTLLDLIFMRVKKISTKSQMPIIISCNQTNFKKIQNFFRQRNYYGLEKSKFRFMEVQCLPILDINGKYCINQKYKLIKRPFGTGRNVIEILKQRNMDWLAEEGVKYIHFIGAQNIMQVPLDPLMLGLLNQKKKKICAKCVGTSSQWQKLPRYVASPDNKIHLKLWNQLNSQISQKDLLSAYRFPIATNSIIFQLSYLQELIKDYHTDQHFSQNYHILRSKQRIINPQTNRLANLQCITFQGDIRDLLACSNDPLLVYAQRNQNYAPIFSKKDDYPLEGTVQYYEKIITQQYLNTKSIHEFIKAQSNLKQNNSN